MVTEESGELSQEAIPLLPKVRHMGCLAFSSNIRGESCLHSFMWGGPALSWILSKLFYCFTDLNDHKVSSWVTIFKFFLFLFFCLFRSVPVAFATATPELGIHWILTLLFIFNFLETNCTFPTLVTTMNHNMILFSSQPTMTLNLTRGRSEIRIHSAETMPEYPWILQRWQPNVTHISSIPRAFSGARHWTLNISFGYCQPKLLWPSTPGRSCAVVVQPILSEAPTAGRGAYWDY